VPVTEHHIQLTLSQTVVASLVGAFGTIVVGAVTFFGGRGSVTAQLQSAMTIATKELFETYRLERIEDHKTIISLKTEVLTLTGTVAGLDQHVRSLESLLRTHGIKVPKRPITQTVFVLDRDGDEPFKDILDAGN
jgi:hypothetical protein